MVANSDFFHMAANLFDHARAFMPQYHRQRHFVELIARDHIGMAHSRRYDTDAHFIRSRFILRQLFNLKRPAFLADNGCLDFFHGYLRFGIVRSCPRLK